MSEKITFSFGKNWCDYLATMTEQEIESATSDIRNWLGEDAVRGKTVIDVGSGSGLHSLVFHRLGAERVHSLDVDPHSVAATRSLWEQSGKPKNWVVEQASVLGSDVVSKLGKFDIVYSWGVLHHTGEMWRAIENASELVGPRGQFWISLYQKGARYQKDLALKQRYNAAGAFGKRMMVYHWIARDMWRRVRRFKNPFGWFSKSARGMNTYHDLIDWLGGLPYEVADANEVIQFGLNNEFVVEKLRVVREGGCSVYLMRQVPGLALTAPEATLLRAA